MSGQVQIPTAFFTFAVRAAEEEQKDSSTLKRDLWIKMGNELEIAGYPKNQISKKIQDTIEEELEKKLGHPARINTAYYYRTMASHSWQDEDFARHKSDPPGDQENTSYIGVNFKYINVLQDCAKSIRILTNSLKNMQSLDEIHKKNELNAFFHDLKTMAKLAEKSADAKTVVHPNAHHIFKECMRMENGLLNVTELYFRTNMRVISNIRNAISKKQASKYMHGREPNQLPIFRPKYRDEAIFMGWYGLQCPECKSWRVEHTHRPRCFDCHVEFEGKTVTQCLKCGMMLYQEDIDQIKKTGRCTGCESEMRLPQGLAK